MPSRVVHCGDRTRRTRGKKTGKKGKGGKRDREKERERDKDWRRPRKGLLTEKNWDPHDLSADWQTLTYILHAGDDIFIGISIHSTAKTLLVRAPSRIPVLPGFFSLAATLEDYPSISDN